MLSDDAVCLHEGYFQIGRNEPGPGYPMGRKRGIHAGGTVGEAIAAVVAFRKEAKREGEKMWLAVFVKHNGLITRFTGTFEPNQLTPKWEISG
jgi:hypothetical protein